MIHRATGRLIGLASLLLGACFESGPLDFGGVASDTVAPTDTVADSLPVADSADAEPPADSATAPDTTPADTSPPDLDVADEDDAPEIETTSDADATEVRSCLVDEDCAGVVADDLCAGPIRCLDYGCRPDPAGAVVCTADSPCTSSTCNPATGLCEDENLCSCETPQSMLCGIAASWSSNAIDGHPSYAAYGCGPASPGGPRMRLVVVPASGRVRITGNDAVAGLHVLAGDVCDPLEACVAGGERALYFDSVPGERYTVAVEETAVNQYVSVRADCDVVSEAFCSDGLDDDGDGKTDCADRDCNGIAGCTLPPADEVGLCGDGLDNDQDGSSDCADADCDNDAGCLETCEIAPGSVYCNYKQGLTLGGGTARSTHYSCDPVPQLSEEMAFAITAGYDGPIRIGFQGSGGLTLHRLVDTGRGCTPKDCVAMSTGDMVFDLVLGTTYYLVVDGPDPAGGDFSIEIDCTP